MIARETPSATESGRPNRQGFDGGEFPEASDAESGPSPFDPLVRHISELQMLAGHYLRARIDEILARMRSIVLWAIIGTIGLVVAVAFLATAVVLMLRGIANGLILLGLQPWAAELLTGVVCIAVVGVVLTIVAVSQSAAARRKRRDDYEHFRARYRAKFGHSLEETGCNGK